MRTPNEKAIASTRTAMATFNAYDDQGRIAEAGVMRAVDASRDAAQH